MAKALNKSRQTVVESLWLSFPNPNDAELGGQSLSSVYPITLKDLDKSQHPLVKNICFGVFRHYFFLHAVVNQHLQKPFRNKDRDILFLLLAASYEMLFLSTPDHAVLSEFVDAAQSRKKPWAKALVNAVLRKIQKEKGDISTVKHGLLEKNANNKGFYSDQLTFEHPQWMIDTIQKDWPEHAKEIFEQNQNRPPFCLRINKNRGATLDYLRRLDDASIKYSLSKNTEYCLYIDEAVDVSLLPGFFDGDVSVQDEAAQQAARLLDIKPKQNILDACSAPGGKAGHILEIDKSVNLLCLDNHPKRLLRIEENLDRLSLNAECKTADAGLPDTWWNGEAYDRILLDAPCSASGIIRRNPDIKLLRQKQDIAKLSKLQLELLNQLWPCLKPGGLLLYATCSIFKAENEKVIETFVSQDALSNSVDIEPLNLKLGQDTSFGRQLFPQQKGHDGFFYSLLRKR